MKNIYLFIIASFYSVFGAYAQCEVIITDTFVCQYGDEITIIPEVTGHFLTKTYKIEEVPFQYFILSDEANVLLLTDDDASFPINIGFDFEFFGDIYSEVYIGSNGWVSFSPNQSLDYIPRSLPSNNEDVPVNVIMAPWEDWNPAIAGNITYELQGEGDEQQFIVSFNQLGHFNCGVNTGVLGSFQIILNQQDYSIETHIQQKSSCDTIKAVHGIQNQDGTIAYIVEGRNATVWNSYLEAYKFIPSNNAYFSWLNGSEHLSEASTLQINPNFTNTYTLLFSDELDCHLEKVFEIEVFTALDPIISRIGENLYSSINSDQYSYQWYLGGSVIEGETNPFVELSDFGQYRLEIYNPETSCSYLSRMHLYTPVSILDMIKENIDIYPNPTLNSCVIDVPISESMLLNIYNIQGEKILSDEFSATYHLSTSFPSGVYLVEIVDNSSYSLVKKLLVK